jgi:uncharacterized membrane protein YraQ (UPF0718 family)
MSASGCSYTGRLHFVSLASATLPRTSFDGVIMIRRHLGLPMFEIFFIVVIAVGILAGLVLLLIRR